METHLSDPLPSSDHVLGILEPETIFQEYLSRFFQVEFGQIQVFKKTRQLKDYLRKNSLDLLLMELALPDQDGFELCQWLRQKYPLLPLVAISQFQLPEDRIRALIHGADDVVSKPYHIGELKARVQATLRRHLRYLEILPQAPVEPPKILSQGALKLVPEHHQVWLNEQELYLTPREFELLYLLMTHAGQIIKQDYLRQKLWPERLKSSRIVDTYIMRLRRILESQLQAQGLSYPRIETRYRQGYCLILLDN